MRVYSNIHTAYLGTLADVLDNPDYVCAPRGLQIREKLDYQFRILNPTVEAIQTLDAERNSVIERYTAQETELYNSCSNKVEDFAKASKFWNQIANPDGTINSAYGYLIWGKPSLGNHSYEMWKEEQGRTYFTAKAQIARKDSCYRTPWQWCVEALKADKDTRQALLRFSLPEHHWQGNKDFVCTISGNFLIRDDKLNLAVVMRSNDLVKGLAYDMPWFISLIYKMVGELKETYPNLQPGTYTHLSHSMHMYEKDLPTINKMLGRQQ